MNISASIVLDSHQTGVAPVLNTKTVILPYPASDAAVAHGPSPVKKIRRSDCSVDSDGSRLALVAVDWRGSFINLGLRQISHHAPLQLQRLTWISCGRNVPGFSTLRADLAGSKRYFHGKVASTTVTGAQTQHRWENGLLVAVYSRMHRYIGRYRKTAGDQSWLYLSIKTCEVNVFCVEFRAVEVNKITQSHFIHITHSGQFWPGWDKVFQKMHSF